MSININGQVCNSVIDVLNNNVSSLFKEDIIFSMLVDPELKYTISKSYVRMDVTEFVVVFYAYNKGMRYDVKISVCPYTSSNGRYRPVMTIEASEKIKEIAILASHYNKFLSIIEDKLGKTIEEYTHGLIEYLAEDED